MEQPTQPRQPDHPVLEHSKHVDVGLVARGLGIALAVIIVFGVIGGLIVHASGSTAAENDLPNFITTFGFFFGFLAAGLYVANKATHDRMLHAAFVVVGGFLLAALFTAADIASGLTIESMMPGGDAEDARTTHGAFWIASWVTIPAATFLAASIVPRRGQDWGTRRDEAEDTEL